MPIQTPAQPRFLLSKRQVTKAEKQTPAHTQNGPQQFSSTPRFSASSTPRQTANQPPPFSTPAPSAAKYRQFRGHATSDIIDSSPQSSELVHDEEEHDLHGSIEGDSPNPSFWLQTDGGERSPKRRRISISPGLDVSSQPAVEDEEDDDAVIEAEDELDRVSEEDSQENSESLIGSHELPRKLASGSPEPASRAQPSFQRAPRFKATELPDDDSQYQLPDAFSPQRRGAKYVSDGLAAEVRDWLVQVKGSTDYDRSGGLNVRLLVEAVNPAPGMWLIAARRVRDHGIDQNSTVVKAILAGKGRITGLNSPSAVTPGSMIDISQPAWDVLLQNHDRWAVACDWEVVEPEAKSQLVLSDSLKIAI